MVTLLLTALFFLRKGSNDNKIKFTFYDPNNIKQIPAEIIDQLYLEAQTNQHINWKRFAYVTYVSDIQYLCSTLLAFKSLSEEFKTKAKLVLLMDQTYVLGSNIHNSGIDDLLTQLRNIDNDQVIIKPIEVISNKIGTEYTWSSSYTKLWAFNETDFDRIIYFDSDATIKGNMDELFFLPDHIKFAATLTYWFLSKKNIDDLVMDNGNTKPLHGKLEKLKKLISYKQFYYNELPDVPSSLYAHSDNILEDLADATDDSITYILQKQINRETRGQLIMASDLMVITPSTKTFQYIKDILIPRAFEEENKYDMDLLNADLYNLQNTVLKQIQTFRTDSVSFKPEVMILPFDRYNLLTGTIKNVEQYPLFNGGLLGYSLHGQKRENMDVLNEIVEKAKYIHYSDNPLMKPWHYSAFYGETIEQSLQRSEFKAVCDNIDFTSAFQEKACLEWNSVYDTFYRRSRICPRNSPVEIFFPERKVSTHTKSI